MFVTCVLKKLAPNVYAREGSDASLTSQRTAPASEGYSCCEKCFHLLVSDMGFKRRAAG
jgi:hypothetical protein